MGKKVSYFLAHISPSLLIMDIATCYYRLYSFEEAFVFIVQDFPNAIFATTFSYN